MKTHSVSSSAPSARRRALVALPLALAACSTVSVPRAPTLDSSASWALLPMVNHTETPQAGLRAEAILESLLRNGGITTLRRYPSSIGGDALFEPSERKGVDQALEWRYKVGVDGEPAVGFTLQVLDVPTGRVLWSAAGGRTGWSREALSAVAHQLLTRLSAPLVAAAR
jgi:hypothetical protein